MATNTVKEILTLIDEQPEYLPRITCPYCHVRRALLIIPSTGRFECQMCVKHGRLADLLAVIRGEWMDRHGGTHSVMTERAAVEGERWSG